MTEIERYTPPPAPARAPIDSWVDMLVPVAELAKQIADTEFVPGPLRGKPAAVTAAILSGRERGEGPMTSLQHIHMVDGRPSESAQLWRRRALAAGHRIRYPEMTGTRVIVEGRRRDAGSDEGWTQVTWTMDMARAAGLAGKKNWQSYPRQQLEARATAELCRLLFPDAMGAAALSFEEALDDYVPAAGDEGPPPPPPPPERKRTAQRRSAQPAPPAEPAPTEEQSAPATQGPPLPGEEEPQPPAEGSAEEEAAQDTDPPTSNSQRSALHAQLAAFGYRDRDEKLRVCSALISRQVESTLGLTGAEASAILDTLARCSSQENPTGALEDLLLAASGQAPPPTDEPAPDEPTADAEGSAE